MSSMKVYFVVGIVSCFVFVATAIGKECPQIGGKKCKANQYVSVKPAEAADYKSLSDLCP